MWLSRSNARQEEVIMRTDSHRGRRLRALIVGAFALLVVGLLAGTPRIVAQASPKSGKQAVVTVQGMQCPFCAYGIKKHLAKLPGVTRVDVELARNQAIVTFAPDAEASDEQIRQAVRKAGFTPGTIEWRSEAETAAT